MRSQRRLELVEELGAAGLLVGLADRRRAAAQAVERAEEPAVGLVPPPHVARAPPARLPEPVEAAVVADPEARVGLDRVAGELAQAGPAVEEAGPPRDHGGDRVASVGARGARAPRPSALERLGRFGVEHGLGQPCVENEMGWSVTGRRLGGAPVEFGGVTDQPPPDPPTPRSADPSRAPEAHPPGARASRRHRADRADALGPCPGHRPLRRRARAGEGARRAPRGAPGRGGLRQPDRAHHADRRSGRAAPRPRGAAAAGRDRGRLRRVDRRQAHRPGQDRPLEDGPARAVARRGSPTASRWPRCSRAWSPRSRRSWREHPGELVVVVSHADPIKAAIAHYTGVHLDLFQRIVVSPASVTVFELSAARRGDGEVQRHRLARRAAADRRTSRPRSEPQRTSDVDAGYPGGASEPSNGRRERAG